MAAMNSCMLAYGPVLPSPDVFALTAASLRQHEAADNFLHNKLSRTLELP